MSFSEMITYSTVLIRCEYNDGTSGSGTGFIMNICNDSDTDNYIPILITNNHVVENCVKTVFEFCEADENGNPIDKKTFSFIYEGNSWIHHPDENVDLCCLLLAETLTELEQRNAKIFYISLETVLIPNQEVLSKLSAMEEVVMVGYPRGLSDEYNHKPIIRRGITSSHPKKDYQGKKETLLDISSYPGSSGSPIFILNQGTYTEQNNVVVGTRIYLLGVLYGVYEFDAVGVLQFANLPNSPVPVTRIPINLGIMIKSERIFEFEEMFKNVCGGQN